MMQTHQHSRWAVPSIAPHSRGELIELRPEPQPLMRRPPAPRRDALTLYPDYAGDITALKRVAIASVHGFFPLAAWESVCAQTKLYMLPMSGTAKGQLAEIKRAVDEREERQRWRRHKREDIAIGVLNEMSQAGTLLPSVFPDFRQASGRRWHDIGFDYPSPPKEVAMIASKARLAGYEPMIAIPGQYVRLNSLATLIDTEPQMAPADRDPIVYAVKGSTAVVLTHYGDIDAGPMAALVEVLKEMDVQL